MLDFAKAMKCRRTKSPISPSAESSGVIIAVSGYVKSPSSVGGAPSDLPFTVLGRLRESGIALSSPQSTVLVTESGEKLQPGK